jgi:hypothetical protein
MKTLQIVLQIELTYFLEQNAWANLSIKRLKGTCQ